MKKQERAQVILEFMEDPQMHELQAGAPKFVHQCPMCFSNNVTGGSRPTKMLIPVNIKGKLSAEFTLDTTLHCNDCNHEVTVLEKWSTDVSEDFELKKPKGFFARLFS